MTRPEPVFYRGVDGRASPPWDEARTYRCKCGTEMTPSGGLGIISAMFQCDACDRLLVLNYPHKRYAWFVPEKS